MAGPAERFSLQRCYPVKNSSEYGIFRGYCKGKDQKKEIVVYGCTELFKEDRVTCFLKGKDGMECNYSVEDDPDQDNFIRKKKEENK